MTSERSFSSDAAKPTSGEVITLAVIAGVILAALASAVAVMATVSGQQGAGWTGFSIGTVFGVTCALSAVLIASRRS